MKWAIIGVAVIAACVLAAVLSGVLLPRDHVATRLATIAAPPESVWVVITNPRDFPAWRVDVDGVELLSAVGSRESTIAWREYRKSDSIGYVIEGAEQPRRMVTRLTDQS